MTLQEVIDTRQRYYLEMQVERLLSLPELNERQWHALHYMQFCIFTLFSDEPTNGVPK
jgi:hypothetical protein